MQPTNVSAPLYGAKHDCLRRERMNFFSSLSSRLHFTSRVRTSRPSSGWARPRYHPLGSPLLPSPLPGTSSFLGRPPSPATFEGSRPGQMQVAPSGSHRALWAMAPPTPSARSAPPPAHLRMRLRPRGTSCRSPPTVDMLPRRSLKAVGRKRGQLCVLQGFAEVCIMDSGTPLVNGWKHVFRDTNC